MVWCWNIEQQPRKCSCRTKLCTSNTRVCKLGPDCGLREQQQYEPKIEQQTYAQKQPHAVLDRTRPSSNCRVFSRDHLRDTLTECCLSVTMDGRDERGGLAAQTLSPLWVKATANMRGNTRRCGRGSDFGKPAFQRLHATERHQRIRMFARREPLVSATS